MTDIRPQESAKMLVEMSIDQVSAYIQNGGIQDLAVYSKTCVDLGSAIDSAIGMDEVPSSRHLLKLFSVIKKVYIRKADPREPSLMLFMLSIKAACKVGWFPAGDITNDLLLMANEVINGFSPTNKMIIEPSYAHSRVLDIISRFYPRMKVERILTSFDAKAGYGTFIADFHLSRSMSPPHFENLWLLVARTDNMDTAACIASPSNVEFLLNGSGVQNRTKGDMGKGPQLPSNVAKMVKYGVNLLEVLGDFEGQYTIAIAIVNLISSPDPPQLQDYVHPMSEKVDLDGDIIQISSWISLNCPLSQFRIKTPVKGYLCKHPQCFDYTYFMAINTIRPTWKCPICRKPVCNLDIRIVQDVVKILNDAAENVTDVIISTDGSWVTSMTEKSEITKTNTDTISQNKHVTDNTENHTTITANDPIDNSSSALRNLGGSPVSASAEPPCTSWQSTVTTPAIFSPPAFLDPRLPPLVTCDPVVPPSSTNHINSINLTTRSTTQVPYSLTNPNHPSLEAQPQQGQADRATQADAGISTTEQSQGATTFTPSTTNSQHSISLPFNQLNAPVESQVNQGKTAQAQSTTVVTPVQVTPSETISPPSKQLERRGQQQHNTTDPGQPLVNVGATAKAQCKTTFTPSVTSSQHPIALPLKYYSRRDKQNHNTDSEQSQVSVDEQTQNTTTCKPDATSSPHSIGLAVALAFQHLKRGDGQRHNIQPGQSQPEVGTTKLTPSIARPKKFRRVDELYYSVPCQSQAKIGANKQDQRTGMFTPLRLRPSGQVDVQLRKGACTPACSTTKTPSLDSHLITARTSMLGQDVQQHYTTPPLSKVNIGKTNQVQSTTMLPPAAIKSLRSMTSGYEQRRYTPGHSQAQSSYEMPMAPPAATSSLQSMTPGYEQRRYTPGHSQAQSLNEGPMLPPAAASSLQSIPPGYEQRRYTPGHSQAQTLNKRPMLPPAATSSLQSIPPGYEQRRYAPGQSQAQSLLNKRPMSQTRLQEPKGDAPPRQPT